MVFEVVLGDYDLALQELNLVASALVLGLHMLSANKDIKENTKISDDGSPHHHEHQQQHRRHHHQRHRDYNKETCDRRTRQNDQKHSAASMKCSQT